MSTRVKLLFMPNLMTNRYAADAFSRTFDVLAFAVRTVWRVPTVNYCDNGVGIEYTLSLNALSFLTGKFPTRSRFRRHALGNETLCNRTHAVTAPVVPNSVPFFPPFVLFTRIFFFSEITTSRRPDYFQRRDDLCYALRVKRRPRCKNKHFENLTSLTRCVKGGYEGGR